MKLSAQLPILSDGARPQGWSWQKDSARIDIPALDPQEALTFKLIEQYMQFLLPDSTLQHLRPYFRAASSVLDARPSRLAKWPRKIRVLPKGQPQLSPQIKPSVQAAIYRGLLEERQIAVTYQPAGVEGEKKYEVNPLALVIRPPVVYLVCTMWDYEEERQLALHRVKRADVLEHPAKMLENFDIDEYIRKGAFGFERGRTITLELALASGAAQQLRECPISENQVMKEMSAGRVRLRATVQDTEELRWWISSFGPEAEVLKPAALRAEFRERANELRKLYL